MMNELNFKHIADFIKINGIVHDPNKVKKTWPLMFRDGLYLGAPGKDIFFILPQLNSDEKECLSDIIALSFPSKPPGNHVRWAAFIRYIYGCFEKQGCLRSENDKNRMIQEKTDWSIHDNFVEQIMHSFKKHSKEYGLVIGYEMIAHRYGDKMVISGDTSFAIKMEELYNASRDIAVKIKSYKHTFTPYYWAGCYFYEMKMNKKALEYHQKCLKSMNKYCPDAREGYREKAKTSIQCLKSLLSQDEFHQWVSWIRRSKNKCLKKIKVK